MKYVASMKMEHCETFSGLEKLLQSLDLYLRDHPVMKPETFDSMFQMAEKLESEKLLDQCRVAKARCEETQNLLNLRRSTLKRAKEKMIEEQNRRLGMNCDEKGVTNLHNGEGDHNVSVEIVSPRREVSPIARSWDPQCSSTPYSVAQSHSHHPELRKCVSERSFNQNHPDSYITEDMSDRIVTSLPKLLTDSKLRSSKEDLIDVKSESSSSSPTRDPSHSDSPNHLRSPRSRVTSEPALQSPGSSFSPHNRPLKKVLRRTATQPLPDSVILEEDLGDSGPLPMDRRQTRPYSMITASTDSLSR